jgi:hypothetical protein
MTEIRGMKLAMQIMGEEARCDYWRSEEQVYCEVLSFNYLLFF